MVDLNKFMMLNWPMVLTTTAIFYVLVLLTLPFNHIYATIFLFCIIAFWSRLPGVGFPAPFYFVFYLADVIDIFSVIIAVNVGPVEAATFSLFLNLWSRLCGAMPPEWGGVISDSLSQFAACFAMPFVHVLLGSNIYLTVTAYSVLRILFILPLDQIFYRVPWPRYLAELVFGGIALFAINIFYTKLFGNFMNGLLENGVSFNWTLFLFTTLVIVIFYLALFKNTQSISIRPVINNLIKTLRRRFVHNQRMKYEDKDNLKEMSEMDEIKKNI